MKVAYFWPGIECRCGLALKHFNLTDFGVRISLDEPAMGALPFIEKKIYYRSVMCDSQRVKRRRE